MSALQNLSTAQQAEVRAQVRELLERTPAYLQLDPAGRRGLASGLVDVVAYLSDPSAGQAGLAAKDAGLSAGLAEQQQTGAQKLQDRLAGKQDLVGKDFDAGAMRAATGAFKELVGAVDFPKFVSGLIEGVFTSIVDSSIRQMEAYGKLLEAVVKNVEQFAADNVSQNQARDFLQDRFPDTFTVNVDSDQPRLGLKDGADDDSLARVKQQMGLEQDIDLDDEESEAELARRAQLEMARMRQQQLATMVLLGINRIIVTDGLINAKVVFEVKASDQGERTNRASMYDTQEKARQTGSGGGWFSGDYDNTQEKHKTVVSSSTTDESESKAQLKANLTGEVRVNFKSDVFPLSQMTSPAELTAVNERAKK